MRYDDRADIDAAYGQIAALYEELDDADGAMALAEDLLARGEDRSWASVWWAYGAIHHDLSDEAYARALELLARVDASAPVRAAALMLTAEIESTQAIEAGGEPDAQRQAALLGEATTLAPDWPSLRLRLAYPLRELGEVERSREEARAALNCLLRADPSKDPFDSAISGSRLDREYVERQVEALTGGA